MKTRIVLAVICAILTVCQLLAAPARRDFMTITQPDGTSVVVRLCGDEYHHYYVTEDGDCVTRCEDGYFYYTTLDADNNPVASNVKQGCLRKLSISNDAIMMRHGELQKERRSLRKQPDIVAASPMRKVAGKARQSDGEVKGLIILVNFQDKSFETSQSTINDMMNSEGYTDSYGSIGSARDYFNAQSYGQFKPSFDVVGPVTLSRNMSYYGGNDRYGTDQYPDVMVSEACELASEQGLVDMSDYDIDGDGWVDLIYVIYAGYAESSGAPANTVWPHAWYIYSGAGRTVQVDGVYLDAYACSSELNGSSGSKVDGIGTFCHEYSHTLGLPDLYDIDYSGGVGMNDWSVMDAGCYARDGYVPIAFSAFERSSCGWIELNELTVPTSVEMPDLNTDKTAAYRISSTNVNQYITLETRSQKGWDVGLPASGMMVTAIDYNASVWNNNAPNDTPSRQRVKLIPADNKWSDENQYGDLFPYGGATELTSTSTPVMKVYTTTIEDKPVTDITYNNGVATFDFMGGSASTIEAPVATAAGNVTSTGFTAYWSPVAGAVSYDLYVERMDEGGEDIFPDVAFEENFDGFTASSSEDVTSSLDLYTSQPGWSGYKVFCSSGMVKLGSSKATGSLTTPTFEVAEGHTVYFDAAAYNPDAESGLLTLSIEYDGNVAVCEIDMSEIPSEYLTTIAIKSPYGATECMLTFDCTKRLFLDDLKIENSVEESGAAMRQASICIDALTGEMTRNDKSLVSRATVVSESCTFEDITTTSYYVDRVINDVCEGLYRYKVRAVVDDGSRSEWSNVIEVNVQDGSAVSNVDIAKTHVYVSGGTIYISREEECVATIYNMQGVLVATIRVKDGMTTYTPVTEGIYIVKCGTDVVKLGVK